MTARAGIVVTGTEVLTGRVQDRNGPWLADRLLELGIELAHITICADRPQDMLSQLRFMAAEGMDLVITSGGLGPTADDLTATVVADFQGRAMRLDEEMEAKIWQILQPMMKRWKGLDPEAIRASNRKQAMVPEGAAAIDPAGTAPGLVVPPAEGRAGPTVVVLPGPPRELHAMWPAAVETGEFAAATRGRTVYTQEMLRLFGIPESEIAETLRVAEPRVEGFEELEVTTCLRRGEVEVVVRHDPAARPAFEELRTVIAERHADTLFSADGRSVDAQVFDLLSGRSVAVAESCTGGLMAARLTDPPGASAHVAGGVVAYSDRAKAQLLGVDPDLIAAHGAVSPEVAEAMASGALSRFGADVAVAITGVAGPGGGAEAKPVGYVCWNVALASGEALARDTRLPGDRREVRDRSTTVGMHMLRLLLGPCRCAQRLG